MTPEEAQKRWCPFANAEAYKHTRCIADCCMAWRWSWTPEQAASYAKPLDESRLSPAAKAELAMMPHEPKKLEPSGYCGLAGSHGN